MSNTQDPDEKMLFSPLLGNGICTQLPKGEQRVRRRRKKPAREAEDSAAEAATEARKRRLSEEQARFLETSFVSERKLESGRKAHLASELGLDPKQVAVWFQNRRARWKSKRLEEEYSRLKSAHEAVIVDKCHLEAEVLKLKEQLAETRNEIRRLTSAAGDLEQSSSSPSSVVTEHHQPLVSSVVVAGEEELVVGIENYSYATMLDCAYDMYMM